MSEVNTQRYFSYDPCGDFEFHDTEEAARAAFDDAIELAREALAQESSDDNESQICWGAVHQRVDVTDRALTSEEQAQHPDVVVWRELGVETLVATTPVPMPLPAPMPEDRMRDFFLYHAPRFTAPDHVELCQPVKIWNYRGGGSVDWDTVATDGKVLLMVRHWAAPGALAMPRFSYAHVSWAWALDVLWTREEGTVEVAPQQDWRWICPEVAARLRTLPGILLWRVPSVTVTTHTTTSTGRSFTTKKRRLVEPGAAFFTWDGGVGLVVRDTVKEGGAS